MTLPSTKRQTQNPSSGAVAVHSLAQLVSLLGRRSRVTCHVNACGAETTYRLVALRSKRVRITREHAGGQVVEVVAPDAIHTTALAHAIGRTSILAVGGR